MIPFPRVNLPEGPLTEKELGDLKAAVENLAAAGHWKPCRDKIMGVQTSAGIMVLQATQPANSMVGADPVMTMVRHTAFAAYAPDYIRRLIAEVERLQQDLRTAKGQ